MNFTFFTTHLPPEESYSRSLDKYVAMQEKPYGYDVDGPPAGHSNGMNSFPSHEQKGAYQAKGKELRKK